MGWGGVVRINESPDYWGGNSMVLVPYKKSLLNAKVKLLKAAIL
jgi:hypothetical protein